jgi:class 3 adenylate cyclase
MATLYRGFENVSDMISDIDVVRRYTKYVFLDVVGFSKRSAEAQSQIVKALNTITHAALRQGGVDDQDRILIPTGDGMCIALVNIQLPYDAHIQTAFQILKLLSEHNQSTPDASRQFEVRIGVNQNTDILVEDVNDRPNIAGAGINLASRIMDKADGNQILVSQTVHDELQPSERYMNNFRAFYAVGKHRIQFRVYQYIGAGRDGLNINLPTEFAATREVEPKLSQLAAYYFAHAITNQSFIVKAADDYGYAVMVTLWFLAKDSVGEGEATEIAPYTPHIFGEGKLSLEEVVKHNHETDFRIQACLANYIQTELDPYEDYLEPGAHGYLYLFVNKEGKQKLQRERPKIWKDFNLG